MSTNTLRTIAGTLLLLSSTACGGSTPAPQSEPAPSTASTGAPVSTSTTPKPATTSAPSASSSTAGDAGADSADQACSADGDCELVELGCCDHCNGGKLEAFNNTAAAKHRPTCGPTPCTKRACARGVAKCVAQRCTVTNAPLP